MDAVVDFINCHGYPDLEAGHDTVVVGLDANIMPWRLPEVLDFDSETGDTDAKGRRPTNGYALATGSPKVETQLERDLAILNARE